MARSLPCCANRYSAGYVAWGQVLRLTALSPAQLPIPWPRPQQAKVSRFVEKFRENPAGVGINYERIAQARDKNLRSVRIDDAYRGIVLRPEKGNVYVLLWVDHHDEAYRWAANKVCTVHPESGSLQLIDVTAAEAATPATDRAQ
jgi:hypothetical protein